MKHKKSGDGFKPCQRKKSSDNRHIRKPVFMLQSAEYKGLHPCSKLMMDYMQVCHYPNKFTGYGWEQAKSDTGYGSTTVSKSFDELINKGFINLQENYNHSAGKVRTWELTWMSYHGKPPQDLWQ